VGQALPPAIPSADWKYRRPVRYIAVSEFVKSVLLARGVPAEKIAVVYDGVPLLNISPPIEPPRIVAPANAGDPRKGAALALEAARLAGVELHLSDNLERDLAGASLFLYITHSEGLGSGALLAMSAGVPVLASNVGGLPEIIRHGENGWLVENASDAIAAAIRRLAADPALTRALALAGRRTVEERFTVERMVRRTMEVYRQALS
jgi:glycosyltransferase involved in cell wall biosynthesis